jgi:L-alanine-DL-glutamate epimerase-like enolase superfamily enzyme
MRIVTLETIRLGEFPNILLVRLHTDEGAIGLGETFFGAPEVEAYLHGTAASRLLGQDAARLEALRIGLQNYVGTRSTGVEARGNSAVDLALWDLLGQGTERRVVDLLGGETRPSIRAYNTCAGYRYVRATRGQAWRNWGRPTGGEATGPYEDLDAFLEGRAGALAQSLLAQGITGMKMWPFDEAAYRNGGLHISALELDRALEPFRQARRAVGDRMDLMVELHGLWNLPTALRIAHAFEIEGLRPYWIEDPLRPDDITSLAAFARGTAIPTTASEMLGGRQAFRDLLEARAASIVMLDLGWCGGLTEGKAIATMAEAFGLPVAPHDCTGPVVWAASVHLALNAPNALIQETVRAFYTGWYKELVTGLPVVEDGQVRLGTDAPGLGVALAPGLAERPDAVVRRTAVD